ncbi:MAG TPA: TldD/PmbA family protein [Solirubrobacterales bacterium]|nr:TldD/PmbA family protein [Solirubrobacterales bacterium]
MIASGSNSEQDLETIAGSAVEAAVGAGAGDAEAFVQDSTGLQVRVFDQRVESLTEAGERGLGVRVWVDGRAGYAYGTDLGDRGIGEIAAGAVEAARVADPDEFAAAPEAIGEPERIEGLADPEAANWKTERKVELAIATERAAREADGRVAAVETTVFVDERAAVALASSRGASGAYEATYCYAFLSAIAEEGDDRQTGLGFGMGRSPAALDPEGIGREAAERSTALLGAAKPASRTCPVVLDETVAASFAGFIGGVLCADAVQRGRSPFAGRLGEAVGSSALTLADDGADPAGLNSGPFDGEGTPSGRTTLIERGELSAYLHDSYTARREGGDVRSTANAARSGYRSPPSVSTSNLIVATGELGFDELLAEAGDGMYVTDVAGLHSGVNPVSGTFSVGATGRAISGGELAEPADEFTIASDLPSMLAAVRATGSEARWVPFGGSVATPALLIGEMAIGGA